MQMLKERGKNKQTNKQKQPQTPIKPKKMLRIDASTTFFLATFLFSLLFAFPKTFS